MLKVSPLPIFPQNLEAAIAIQQELHDQVIVKDQLNFSAMLRE